MSSLDDFFAKKDRKKKGIKSSDGSKSDKNQATKKEKTVDITDNFKYINDNSDEWLDFEENRDKDYSGLKIQALSIKDKEQITHEQRLAESNDDSKDGKAWSSKTQTVVAAPPEDKIEEEKEEEVKKEPEQQKKYVPPSQRSSLSEVPKRVTKNNKAPEIENKSEFPTLA